MAATQQAPNTNTGTHANVAASSGRPAMTYSTAAAGSSMRRLRTSAPPMPAGKASSHTKA